MDIFEILFKLRYKARLNSEDEPDSLPFILAVGDLNSQNDMQFCCSACFVSDILWEVAEGSV